MNSFDVHLQAVSTAGPVATLLAHVGLLSAVFARLVHSQLSATQEGFGTFGALQYIRDRTHRMEFMYLLIYYVFVCTSVYNV